MIRALLPLNMYVITYELAYGRPYSKLEELLLRAVDEASGFGGCTFGDLREVFKVHDRLFTEGLVTLIREGWVAMEQRDREMRSLVTEEGRLTIASGRRPSNLRVRTAHATIVRERLTGQLARANELALINANTLRSAPNRRAWKVALKSRLIRSAINGGEAERLLPRSDERQEWIRWIDSVARVSQDLHYLPVRVDVDEGKVFGLPYQWQHVAGMIIEEVAERREELMSDPTFQNELRELMRGAAARNGRPDAGEDQPEDSGSVRVHSRTKPYAVATVTCRDVVLTAVESRRLAQDVLARCSGNVLIIAGRLDRGRATAAKDVLINLRAKGVQADLLWSCDQSDGTAREILGILGAARANASLPGAVMFNRTPSAAAADLILASTASGPVAVVGASFLENSVEAQGLSPAARLSDPAVLAGLARLCAGWWEEIPGDEGTLLAHRWKHLAERWASQAVVPRSSAPLPHADCAYGPAPCTGEIALLTGTQQAAVRRELTAEGGPRFMIADGCSSVEALTVEVAEILPATVGSRYRALGATDGWRLMRRTGDTWSERPAAQLPPPSGPHRVMAVREQWLVEYAEVADPALSFCLTGHVAAQAWERTSNWVHAGQSRNA